MDLCPKVELIAISDNLFQGVVLLYFEPPPQFVWGIGQEIHIQIDDLHPLHDLLPQIRHDDLVLIFPL